MSTWTKQKLGSIGRVVTGKTPPTTNQEYFGVDYPFITPSDISDYKVRRANNVERFLSEKWKLKAKNYLLPPKTICYICIGSTVGKSCLTDINSFSNQQSNSLICDKDKAQADFVFYLLKKKTAEIKKIADSTGAGKGIINKTSFENLDLILPDLPTQARIASVLSAYDDLIENNEKRIKILEEMAQRMYREWFVKFNFPGSTYAKASADRHEKVRLIDSGTEYGKIPEGWGVKRLGDIVNVVSGFPFKSTTYLEDGKYKIVTIKNVHDGVFVLNFDSFINDLPAKLPANCVLNSGDVLLSLTGNVGRVCIVYGADYLLNQRVAKLEPIGSSVREFMYLLFRQRKFQQKLEAISNGAAQQNLSPIQMKELEIVIPPKNILDKYSDICKNYFDEIVVLCDRNQNLSKTRDLLIPQLVTGKREVK